MPPNDTRGKRGLFDVRKQQRSYYPVELDESLAKRPEVLLWAHVLMHGIATALSYYRTKDLKRTGAQADRRWFFRDQGYHPGSCLWICDVLGINRERLISHVFRNRHSLKREPHRFVLREYGL